MEHIIAGILDGSTYQLTIETEEITAQEAIMLEVTLQNVAERTFQFIFEYPGSVGLRNNYYSEILRLGPTESILRYPLPEKVKTYPGKVYVQIVGGESGALRYSVFHDDAAFVCRSANGQGSPCQPGDGMLEMIRSTCDRVENKLEEFDEKTEEFANTYAVAQNEETASAKDTYSCDYINELHREALDVDPYFESTAGSVVAVSGTPAGKYVELEDYKILLPLRQDVSPNLLSAQPVINNSQTILADFGRDVTISAVLGFSVKNFAIETASAAIVGYRKDDGTHQYRTGGHFGWHVGETYNGVYSNKLENVTCRYIVFYGYDDGYAVMNGTIQNAMMNLGATLLPYEPYTGQPSPENPVAVESPSQIKVTSTGRNLVSVADREIVVDNWYYRDLHSDPPFQMGVGKTYTLAYEYTIENATAPVLCDIGRGSETSYDVNIINALSVAGEFPASGRFVASFKVYESNYGNYFHFRPLRFATPNTLTNARIANVMLIEGAYTAETMPEYLPYETETVTIAPKDTTGNAVALWGGVSGAENTIEYRDQKLYCVRRTTIKRFDGSETFGYEGRTDSGAYVYKFSNSNLFSTNPSAKRTALCDRFSQAELAGYGDFIYMTEGQFKQQNLGVYFATSFATVAEFKTWLAAHPTTLYFESATPIETELDPASLPTLQTYALQTTFMVTSDVAGLNPSIDLTRLAAIDATFAKGLLKLKNGEVLTPLTTADMVLTADGRTLDAVLEEMRAKLYPIGSLYVSPVNEVPSVGGNWTLYAQAGGEAPLYWFRRVG